MVVVVVVAAAVVTLVYQLVLQPRHWDPSLEDGNIQVELRNEKEFLSLTTSSNVDD